MGFKEYLQIKQLIEKIHNDYEKINHENKQLRIALYRYSTGKFTEKLSEEEIKLAYEGYIDFSISDNIFEVKFIEKD